jgi:hypothetical protein
MVKIVVLLRNRAIKAFVADRYPTIIGHAEFGRDKI